MYVPVDYVERGKNISEDISCGETANPLTNLERSSTSSRHEMFCSDSSLPYEREQIPAPRRNSGSRRARQPMKKRISIVTLITICLFVFTAHFLRANADSSSRPPKTADDQHPALQNPDKFAWEMFVEINKPAQSGSTTSTWETWASDDDVFSNPKSLQCGQVRLRLPVLL